MHEHDFVCFQETHSQEGKAKALEMPDDCVAIRSGGSTRQAGVGIALKHSFLKLFNPVVPEKDFEIVVPGRIVILHLSGPLGNLDINCSYLDAGCPNHRKTSLTKLSKHLRPQTNTLSLIMGDFNFVVEPEGRWSASAGAWAPNGDLAEAEFFENSILKPFGFVEWDQDHFTCEAKGARARLDRVHPNQHVSFQLDRCCKIVVKEWCPDLSAHRPV